MNALAGNIIESQKSIGLWHALGDAVRAFGREQVGQFLIEKILDANRAGDEALVETFIHALEIVLEDFGSCPTCGGDL